MVVARVEIAPVIERKPELGGQRLPARILPRRCVAVANPLRVIAKQQVECPGPPHAVLAVGDQVQIVTVLGEQPKGGLEIAQEAETPDRKQNLHGQSFALSPTKMAAAKPTPLDSRKCAVATTPRQGKR